MRKLFRKLFNLDKIEALELEVAKLKEQWEVQVELGNKDRRALQEQNLKLRKELMLYEKTWRCLDQFENNQKYFVVTPSRYFAINGWKLNKNVMLDVTRRAFRNGFVVATEREAQALQMALRRLME